MVLIGAAIKSVFRYLNKTRAGDSDSKWSVHYTTQKCQRQRLVFIPEKRRSGSTEDLRACNRLTQHIYSRPASSHLHQPSPVSPLSSFGLDQSEGSTHKRGKSRKRSSNSSDEEQNFVLNNARPLTTLVLNPVASCRDVFASTSDATVDEELEPSSRLPTPEERMRWHAETVPADIVPINITGESFDRQASLRRTLSNVDSLPWQTQNRKAVMGVPDAINQKMDSSLESMVLPVHSFVGGPSTSSCTSNHQQKNTEAQQGKNTEIQKGRQSSVRRIQAPRGDGMSSLMASLTSTPKVDEPLTSSSPSSEVKIFSSLPNNSSLNSESSSNSSPDRTLSAFQDKQGFHSDHQPLRVLDSSTGVCPQTVSPSLSLLSSQNITLKPDWSYRCNKPLDHNSSSSSHHFSSSSITNSKSQLSYQAVDDYTQQATHCSCDGERSSYQPLSSSSTVLSDQTGSEWSGIAQEMRCVSAKGWSCKPLLSNGRSSSAYPKSTSLCSDKTTSFLSPNCEKRKSSISSSCSCSVTRSISLRKSKRPPPPPTRSDSLRRKTDHNKSSQCSSSTHQEDTVQMTPFSSPQTFHNPWVPRSNAKIHQCGLNCRTVTTFEPLDFKTVPSADSPLSTCHTDSYALTGSPCSEEEVLRYTHPLATSSSGFQRHTSPSSGYSSQSNTPTPGTPLSSPLTPSSPQTASPGVFSLPPTFPFPSSHSCSFPPSPTISSLYRTNSHAKVKAKPPVPERKSSLFSSLSSSFSSTSSLSSYTSSESSAKHSLLPPPPPLPPPPLPKYSSLSSLVLYSPISTSLSQAPPLLHSYLPAPLPPSFRLPPPPYSYAIRQTSHHAIVFTESPNNLVPPTTFPPPLFPSELSPHPPPPPSYHLPQSLRESQSYYIKAAMFPCPLVPAQALQSIKLSSVKNPEVEPTANKAICNHVQSNKTHLNQANSNQPVKEAIPDNSIFGNDLDYFTNTDVKLAGIGSENSVCNLNKTKASTDLMANATSLMFGNTDGKQPGHVETSTTNNESANANKFLQDFVYGFTNQRNCGHHVPARPDIQSKEQNSDVIVLLTNKHIPTSNSPCDEIGAVIQYLSPQQEQGGVKMSSDTKLTGPTENVCNVDSSTCTLSQSKQKSLRGNGAKLSERKDEVQTKTRSIGADLMTSCPQEIPSPQRPVLPNKPDLCILGLSMSPEARPGGCRNSGKTTEYSFGLINHPPQLPPQHLTDNSSTSVSTTQRQKPPILHKKPDMSLTSPRTTKSLFAPENTVEAFKPTSKTGTTTQTSALGIIGTTGTVERSTFKRSPNTIKGTMSILENSDTSGTRDTLLENSKTTVNVGDTAGSTKTACEQIYRPRLKKDDETIFQQEMMRSSLAEEEEEPRKTKTTMMVLMPSAIKKKSRKKRKRRRAGRQLLMSSTAEPIPSSSSSSSSSSSLLSSSSSGDEQDGTRERAMGMNDPEMSDSVVSCTLNGQSRCSLGSAPSNNSLQGELSLSDLLIQETNEVEKEVVKVHPTQDADLFISMSAEQMFVSGQPRTTEDLFAVIHRSKRKMLGRKNSSKDKHSIFSSPSSSSSSSSSSPPVTPTDPQHLIRPAASRSQRSARSESFKALLLRKGSRSHSSSRTSAAERLCKVAISATATDPQSAPPLPLPHRIEVKASSSSFMADKQQLTLDTPASSCSMNVLVMLRQRDLRHSHLLLTSSSPFLFLSSSSSSMRPCLLTPPCSSSRHFTFRCRLFATPMTAIFEGEDEEEKDDDKVFIESAEGGRGELGQGMVEIS